MSDMRHSVESQGAKPRDHIRLHHRVWRHAKRHWRITIPVALMLLLILVYVVTNSLSLTLRPGRPAVQPTPEAAP